MLVPCFVVVRAYNMVRVIHISSESAPKEGDMIKRDPLTGAQDWEIVKVYTFEQQQKLNALKVLMGGVDNLSWIIDHDL